MNTTEECLKPKITYADTLRFTAFAYAKLLYFRDRGSTEVAGFCITGTEDPLLVTDFQLIKQKCTGATFELDPNDIVDYMDRMVDTEIMPWACSNILAHTHPPGCSPSPSEIDEENFRKAFTKPSWAIMLIVADGGKAYCRLKINVGPGVEKLLKVEVDFSQSFKASDHEVWDAEYTDKVTEEKFRMTGKEGAKGMRINDVEQRAFPSYPTDDDPLWKDEFDRWAESDLDDDLDCQWDDDGRVWYYDEDEEKWYVYDPSDQKWFIHDEDNHSIAEIKRPKESWTAEVIMWAKNHIDERNLKINT